MTVGLAMGTPSSLVVSPGWGKPTHEWKSSAPRSPEYGGKSLKKNLQKLFALIFWWIQLSTFVHYFIVTMFCLLHYSRTPLNPFYTRHMASKYTHVTRTFGGKSMLQKINPPTAFQILFPRILNCLHAIVIHQMKDKECSISNI